MHIYDWQLKLFVGSHKYINTDAFGHIKSSEYLLAKEIMQTVIIKVDYRIEQIIFVRATFPIILISYY